MKKIKKKGIDSTIPTMPAQADSGDQTVVLLQAMYRDIGGTLQERPPECISLPALKRLMAIRQDRWAPAESAHIATCRSCQHQLKLIRTVLEKNTVHEIPKVAAATAGSKNRGIIWTAVALLGMSSAKAHAAVTGMLGTWGHAPIAHASMAALLLALSTTVVKSPEIKALMSSYADVSAAERTTCSSGLGVYGASKF